jgi:hypothetical protein
VDAAVAGAEAVISLLASDVKDTQVIGTRHILAAMRTHGVQRLVDTTGAGVPDPVDQPQWVHKLINLLIKTVAPIPYNNGLDHARLIRESDRAWTIVRAPMQTDAPPAGRYRVGYVGRQMGRTLSRADLADFVLKQIGDSTYLRQAPVVSDLG